MSRTLSDIRCRLAELGEGSANAGRWTAHLERRWIRCGSPGCRCRRGDPHGPHLYIRLGRRPGRRRRIYVARRHARAVRRWLADFRRTRANMRLALRLAAEICR